MSSDLKFQTGFLYTFILMKGVDDDEPEVYTRLGERHIGEPIDDKIKWFADMPESKEATLCVLLISDADARYFRTCMVRIRREIALSGVKVIPTDAFHYE